jgi:hypothetical protein
MKFYRTTLLLLLCLCDGLVASSQLTYNELNIMYDSAWSYKNLQLIPVKRKVSETPVNKDNTEYISFEDACKTGKVFIKEIKGPAGADISVLAIKNRTHKNIFIHSGEMVAGGKQDRTAATSTIIAPSEDDSYLPVFCIEKGRWSDKSKPYSYAGMADAGLRKQIDIAQKQNDVWKEIDRQYKTQNKQSETWPYKDLHRDDNPTDTLYYNYFMQKLKASDSSYVGFIAVTNNRIINCELFGDEQLCNLSYNALIKSYIRVVCNNANVLFPSKQNIENFTDHFLQNEKEQREYLSMHGRIYRYHEKIIHLVAYAD